MIPLDDIGLPGYYLKFTVVTHKVDGEQRTWIELPGGEVIDSFDSSADLSGGITDDITDPPFTIGGLTGPATASQQIVSLAFGNRRPTGSIHGIKYEDVNVNSQYDPALDRRLGGVTITLYGDVDGGRHERHRHDRDRCQRRVRLHRPLPGHVHGGGNASAGFRAHHGAEGDRHRWSGRRNRGPARPGGHHRPQRSAFRGPRSGGDCQGPRLPGAANERHRSPARVAARVRDRTTEHGSGRSGGPPAGPRLLKRAIAGRDSRIGGTGFGRRGLRVGHPAGAVPGGQLLRRLFRHHDYGRRRKQQLRRPGRRRGDRADGCGTRRNAEQLPGSAAGGQPAAGAVQFPAAARGCAVHRAHGRGDPVGRYRWGQRRRLSQVHVGGARGRWREPDVRRTGKWGR